MTYPPQPGQWNPGPPPPGAQQKPPGHYPSPGWSPQPPPQNQGHGLKWLLIGVSVLLVVAISVGITVAIFLARGSGPDPTTTAAPSSIKDLASANDTGPVSIITAEPTCTAWRTIQKALANVEANGWQNRDPSSQASSWTPEMKAQIEAVGSAMRSSADKAVDLAKQTPHRVIREMYGQFIAYGRGYADSLKAYRPKDDLLSRVTVGFTISISAICDAINYGSISAREASTAAVNSPSRPTAASDPNSEPLFVTSPTSVCVDWVKASSQFVASLADWERLDPNIPATAWTQDQRVVQEGGVDSMNSHASTMDRLAGQSDAPFNDFSNLAALYLRAYSLASPTYTASDSYISTVGLRINSTITAACKSAQDS